MKSTQACLLLIIVLSFILACTAVCPAQAPAPRQVQPAALPGQDIDVALFDLKEMDMHLHAGMERPVGMDEWLDLAVADGRRVILLLDHLELYRKIEQEYAAWAEERGFRRWYAVGERGHRLLMDDLASARRRKDVITFRGWEIYEGELDTGVEESPMRRAEVIGWHISPNNGGDPPDGQTLIRRIKQIKEIQKRFPIPMIVFHPFTMRIENIQRTAQRVGRDLSTLTVNDYRFFQAGEQDTVIDLLRGSSAYIEISHDVVQYWPNRTVRAALIADVRPLAEGGVQFTVSTDNHNLAAARQPFEPRTYCDALGITRHNTNTIVRELLALRARNAVRTARSAGN